jgi:hypothetical protein
MWDRVTVRHAQVAFSRNAPALAGDADRRGELAALVRAFLGGRWLTRARRYGTHAQVRAFNIAGPCRPDRHYMVPPECWLLEAVTLIDKQA